MNDKVRALADTYLVLPSKEKIKDDYVVEIKRVYQNRRMSLPSGRTVQALSREVFEQALQAATLKK